MAGLSSSLSFATWFAGALWVVGGLAYSLEHDRELVRLTAGPRFASVMRRAAMKRDEA